MKWCKTKFEENNSTSQGEQSIKQANNVLTSQVQSTRRRPVDPDCDKQDSSFNEFNGIVKEKLLKKIKQQLSSDKYLFIFIRVKFKFQVCSKWLDFNNNQKKKIFHTTRENTFTQTQKHRRDGKQAQVANP
jgi:hypothetical protein